MPPEDDNTADVVRDQPSESGAESGVAELARVGQEKPQELKEKEHAQAGARKLGKPPSSQDLPQVEWSFTDDGKLVINLPSKVVTREVITDDSVKKPLAAAILAEKPADTKDTHDRKADAGERPPTKEGGEVKPEADKLLEKFKNFTPEERQQLKQDLADIDKLPAE